jgi:hypothetical protein
MCKDFILDSIGWLWHVYKIIYVRVQLWFYITVRCGIPKSDFALNKKYSVKICSNSIMDTILKVVWNNENYLDMNLNTLHKFMKIYGFTTEDCNDMYIPCKMYIKSKAHDSLYKIRSITLNLTDTGYNIFDTREKTIHTYNNYSFGSIVLYDLFESILDLEEFA